MSEIKTNKISPRKGTTQTIGDSGDTVTIPSGVTLSNTGTISGLQKIDWDTTKKTTAFTAVNQTGYFVDTTSAAITVTFPASPSAGNVIGIKDYANTFDTNNLTIDPNGNKIQGTANNFIISVEGTAANFIYVDSTRGWVLTDASKASDITEDIRYVTATGGTVTTCGDYKIHTFTGPGTFCVTCEGTSGGSNKVDYLVIAGGGSGGVGSSDLGGSGGGAGGYRESYCSTTSGCYTASPLATCASLSVSVTGYPITVGAGGTSSSGNSYPGVNNGSDSIFSTITSAGGGHGSNFYMDQPPGRVPGNPGGSGGGAGYSSPAGSGNTPPVSPPQGNPGGTWVYAAKVGGGGGASAAGGNGTPSTPCTGGTAGSGGSGTATAITGSSVTRAGGGGGAGGGYPYYNVSPGSGGSGGGGAGGSGGGGAGTAGTANTGSGGGGRGSTATYSNPANLAGATGGSGIVIIRYKYQN